MRDEILRHLNEPRQLERLYRESKLHFRQALISLYPEFEGNIIADCWYERLVYEGESISWGSKKELIIVAIMSFAAGLIAKLPDLLSLDEEAFYTRNIGFIIFPALSAYFAWKNQFSVDKIFYITGSVLIALLYINFLPQNPGSNTLLLSCVHLPIILWSIVGFAFVGQCKKVDEKRLAFIKYNGDLVVITSLIVIAGGIMAGTTIGLFSLIGFKIERIYFDYVGIFGITAAPMAGTFLTQTNPQLVGKVSPVIAKIFSPLVLVMLIIYLIAIIYSGKNPYNDREFLRVFNILLIGVMAIIFFSVAESSKAKSTVETAILWMLSLVTMIVNSIALSAIVFRIYQFGLTPNRAAVLGGDGLILINLVLITIQLMKVLQKKAEPAAVGKVIATYLPVYLFWAIIVTFIFPLLFRFR